MIFYTLLDAGRWNRTHKSWRKYVRCAVRDSRTRSNITWDQALFSFLFVNNIPAGMAVAVRENVWEPLKLGVISG